MLTAKKKLTQQLAGTFYITRNLIRHSKYMKLLIATMLTGVLVAGTVQAKELYVDSQTGNDATSYANNSAGQPWRTIGRAAWGSTNRHQPNAGNAARAGDTVIIQEGIYDATQTSDQRYYPYYNPANSGTSGNYIIFQANGNVQLRSSSSDRRPLIGSYQRNYIVWDGFTLNENSMNVHADTGPVVIWACNNTIVKNLHITGINQNWNDNHNGIRIENADNITVQNCYITGFYEDHGSGVTTYTSSNVLLEHNEVTNCQQGLFVKGANDGPFIIRYNYIHDSVYKGIRLGGLRSGGAKVYQNVLHDVDVAIHIEDFASDGPRNVQVVNNTLVSTVNFERGSIWMMDHYGGVSNIEIKNNVITDSDRSGIHLSNNDILAELDSDYNLIHNNFVDFRDRNSNMPLSEWQDRHSKDANSITSNPSFVDAGNHNYKVNTVSPSDNAGIDVLDLDGDGSVRDPINIGAYITGNEVIGITDDLGGGGQQPPTQPAPPTNLKIILE